MIKLKFLNNSHPEWIGLMDYGVMGSIFIWDDGSAYSWTNWLSGPSSDNCVVIDDSSSKWVSRSCSGDTALALCMTTGVPLAGLNLNY